MKREKGKDERRNVWNAWKTNKAFLFIIPGLLLFFAFNLYPIAFSIYLAFTNAYFGNITAGFAFIGLRNFQTLLSGFIPSFQDVLSGNVVGLAPSFYYSLGRTFLFVGTSVPLKFLAGLGLGVVLNSQSLRGRGVLRSLLILPWILPSVLSILTWRGLFGKDFGAINGILVASGFGKVNWLYNVSNAFICYNIVEVWLAYPFMMTVIIAALQSVPPALYDAAIVDGASSWQRFRHITVPIIWKPLLFATILTSSASFQSFYVPYLLNAGGPASTNMLVMVWEWTQAFQNPGVKGAMGLAAAFSVLVSLIIVAMMYVGLKIGGITREE